MVAVENTPERHNLVVCTLCSCYPWPVLGLPPVWYKSPAYRSRAVIDPRGVLAEFGVGLPAETQIRVWDSTAEIRYLVVPQRPEGADGWSEERLAALVTRDSMIGVGLALSPESAERRRERRARPRRHDGFRRDRARSRRACVPPRLGTARARRHPGDERLRALEFDAGRHARETLPPAAYLTKSYYDIWISALEKLALRTGMIDEAEMRSGEASTPPAPHQGETGRRGGRANARQRHALRPSRAPRRHRSPPAMRCARK